MLYWLQLKHFVYLLTQLLFLVVNNRKTVFVLKKGDAVTARDEIELPEGWEWSTIWDIDLNRAVDEEGKVQTSGKMEYNKCKEAWT